MFTTLQNFNNGVVVNQVPTTNKNVVIEAATLDQIEKGSASHVKKSFIAKLYAKFCGCF